MKTFRLSIFAYSLCIIMASVSMVGAAPELVFQDAGNGQPSAVAVSNGGHWLASTGFGVQIWDGREGLLWDEWKDVTDELPDTFSPDGTQLLLDRKDPSTGTVSLVLRAVPSGKRLRRFSLEQALAFDGKTVRGVLDGSLIILDAGTGARLSRVKLLDAPGGEDSAHFALSPNGRFVAGAEYAELQHIALIWDAETGRLLRTISGPRNVLGRVAASPDGKWLVTEGENPTWQPPRGASSEASYARLLTLKLWNVSNGALVHVWPGNNALYGGSDWFRFSSDGKSLIHSRSGYVEVWDVATGKQVRVLGRYSSAEAGLKEPIGLSPDGQWVAGPGNVNGIFHYLPGLRLLKAADGQLVQQFPGTMHGADQVKWSPDGKYLAGGYHLTLWDARSGALLTENLSSNLEQFQWKDAHTIQSSNLEGAELWSVPEGVRLLEIKPLQPGEEQDAPGPPIAPPPGGPKRRRRPINMEAMFGYRGSVNLSPDGVTFVTGSRNYNDDALYVWDAATGHLRRKIGKFGGLDHLGEHAWLPDSLRIVRGTPVGMELWNTQTGLKEREWRDPVDPQFTSQALSSALGPLAVSPDGQWLAVHAARNNVLLIYDLKTGLLHRTILTSPAYQARFSQDSSTVWTMGQDGLEGWPLNSNVNSERPAHLLAGPRDANFDISPDGKLAAFGSNDSVQIWNIATGVKALTLYVLDGTSISAVKDWIALTPGGYYDASPGGEQRLRWRDGSQWLPILQSRALFHRPDRVQAALRGE